MRIFIYIAMTLVFACSKHDENLSSVEHGTMEFAVRVESAITELTRLNYELPLELIPNSDDFKLLITGTYIDPEDNTSKEYSQEFLTLAEYNNDIPDLLAGYYKAIITYGDPIKAAVGNACFKGEVDFEVVKRKVSTVDITATIINSAIRLNSTESFDNYYPSSSFVVETSLGNSFNFIPNDGQLIFLPASTTLTLSGEATKTNGVDVSFAQTEIGTTVARTLNTIIIDASEAGGSSVTIKLDDTMTELDATEIELNPEV